MLRYPCLVLDHDDTVVQSTPTINYPSFVESLRVLRPGMEISLEAFLRYCYAPGFFELCTDILGFSDEELNFQIAYWRRYSRSHRPLPYPGLDEILHQQRELGGLICVVSHSSGENIRRDYRESFGLVPDLIYSSDLPPEQRKPSPYALRDIMERCGLAPNQLLMVDDLKPGLEMARACGVPFAAAGWSHTVPELAENLRQCSDFYLESVDGLRHLLFD